MSLIKLEFSIRTIVTEYQSIQLTIIVGDLPLITALFEFAFSTPVDVSSISSSIEGTMVEHEYLVAFRKIEDT